MLPNTFIIGVQKSGTTALHHLLAQHPDVFFPRAPQEIHYFDVEENFNQGLRWYEKHFTGWNGQKIVAQTSPLYFYEPTVPARIHAVAPQARLIVILRNPVDRAYSHYWHEVKHGTEELSFEDAVDREPLRIRDGFESRRHFSYVSRGEYAAQFARFLEHFRRDQILVLRFEDLAGDADAIFTQCAEFLNIPRAGFEAARAQRTARNIARMPRNRMLHALGRRLRKTFPVAGNVIGRLNLAPTSYPKMSDETRSLLRRRFEADIAKTASLTGLDLGSWLD